MTHFEIYRERILRRWRWRLRAANGEIIAHGQPYRDRHDCLVAMALVSQTLDAPVEELA